MIPNTLLENKKILVGITGSISAYKAIELIRHLTKAGADVRVIMTDGAKRFITALTIETLTGNQILDESTENWHSDHNHIGIGKWADAFVIAPVTANTINKLSNGIADNLLTQTALAYDREKIIAPAANTAMIENPLTQAALKLIKLANYTIIDPQTKELACKTEGNGALAEPMDIFYATCKLLLKEDFWTNRRVIVTGGGTIEKIDDVRFISNFSSGKMASSLVLALYFKGADVCFISSAFPTPLPHDSCTIDVQSASEMQEYLVDSIRIAKKGIMTKPTLMGDSNPELIQKEPFLFMAAAVADYAPKFVQEGKLKKAMLGETWDIQMASNIDILESIDKTGIKSVGFKAEMDDEVAELNAANMLKTKNLDAVCLNLLQDSKSFGSYDNAITIFTENDTTTLEKTDKLSLSLQLLQSVQSL